MEKIKCLLILLDICICFLIAKVSVPGFKCVTESKRKFLKFELIECDLVLLFEFHRRKSFFTSVYGSRMAYVLHGKISQFRKMLHVTILSYYYIYFKKMFHLFLYLFMPLEWGEKHRLLPFPSFSS